MRPRVGPPTCIRSKWRKFGNKMRDLAAKTGASGGPRPDRRADDKLGKRARPIIDWLLGEERLRAGRMTFLFDRFARRLMEASLPLDRASMHIQQLHPQFAARSFIWDAEAGGATEMGFQHSSRDEKSYVTSPIRPIFQGKGTIRRRLNDRDGPAEYPILDDLALRGFTDYVIMPLAFATGVTNALSLATQRPGGFKDEDLALLDLVLPAFSTLIELQQTRRTARDLLTTYVGPDTGERIFSGTVQRGEGEVIHAVVWFCDLRGFTALSETEPLDQLITLLNEYFEHMAAPVAAHGGEILKFVGDAVLAIFTCDANDGTACHAVDKALIAAEEAAAGIAALSARRMSSGEAGLDCGIAIHIGNVMYGNVGAADRLDFTVIGPAVNLVCRMETLCEPLEATILVSSDFARLSSRSYVSRGRHDLKGIATPREVFALEGSKAV